MEKEDARKLPAAAQEEKRKLAIRLRKQGKTFKEIGETVGVYWATVHGWWKKYQEQGLNGIQAKQRGRRHGSGRRLSSEQENAMIKMICDKTPDQLKMPFSLWTRLAVKQLAKEQFSIVLPIRTVGHYLKRWGFTPQKPLKKAYEQRPAAVQKWLKETYPEIRDKAKAEDAEIHWGDETGLRSDDQRGRGYAPKGKTPIIRLCARRDSMSLISTITNQGKVRFMTYENGLDADKLIKFMKRLIADSEGKKIFLILDNLRVHHARIVKDWLALHLKEIEVFYLPSYSPELNPDEYLNCDLKAGVASRVPARDKKNLTKATISHLRMLQKTPGRVRKYFEHHAIRYAA